MPLQTASVLLACAGTSAQQQVTQGESSARRAASSSFKPVLGFKKTSGGSMARPGVRYGERTPLIID